jgi:hypothetical protein
MPYAPSGNKRNKEREREILLTAHYEWLKSRKLFENIWITIMLFSYILPNISLTRTSYFSKIFYYISFEGPTLIVA